MRTFPLWAALCCISSVWAAPRDLEETAKIDSPDGGTLNGEAAVEGDWLLTTGGVYPEDIETQPAQISAYAFHRASSGQWQFAQKLITEQQFISDNDYMQVAMRGSVAAVSFKGLRVFERSSSGWSLVPSTTATLQDDLETDGTTILGALDECSSSARALRKSAGVWQDYGLPIQGAPKPCGNYPAPDVAISGNVAAVMNLPNGDPALREVRIYEAGQQAAWTQVATLTSPDGAGHPFGPSLALDGSTLAVSGAGYGYEGIYIFTRENGVWSYSRRVLMPESLHVHAPYQLVLRNGLLLVPHFDIDSASVISVFKQQTDGSFKYVARLASTQPHLIEGLTGFADVSGSRIVAAGDGSTYVYDLPNDLTQPASVQIDFESGAGDWVPSPGASFSVVSRDGSRVYRQSSLAGDAFSIFSGVDWQNESIEADIRPTGYSGTDRWTGLIVRYIDADNFYYVTLRSSNVIALKRKINGTFTTIASQTLSVPLNTTRRIRLEAVGTAIRAYVDGLVVLRGFDDQLRHGRVGIAMYKAQADIDNVLISPNRYTRLIQYSTGEDNRWTASEGNWAFGPERLTQFDRTGDARATAGIATDDQVIQVRATPQSFLGSDRWIGVMARYRGPSNYYYVTVRSSNTISLRKVVDGTVSVLATGSLPVSTGTTYLLRLAAVGNALKVWVNGNLALQATDSSHAQGRYGFATYKASGTFDDVLVYQP
ncbi:MAG TPA: hypothetical protein VFS47_06040 [Steroidobacteraceae bacterium]|nr:hypothetical protein [Steroidobacteraceae bacterium]